MKEAVQVAYNEVIASASAIEIFKSMNLNGKIGIILNLTPSYPASSQPEDRIAANYADLFFNRSFLDPSVKGKFPEELVLTIKELNILPITEEGDLELIKKNTIDILGINYYQPRRIKEKKEKHRPKDVLLPDNFFDYYDMPNKKMNPYRGWEIYEKGIYDILTNLRENYGNILCYISENGMGVEGEERFMDENGQINDDYRIEFVSNHLKYVHQAIQEGSNVQGYHMWTCMDNWSWTNAYKNRYGFISVDLDNDGQRSIKKSGYWFKKLSKNNGFN
jgi:6-phospho-beta-glucosidase